MLRGQQGSGVLVTPIRIAWPPLTKINAELVLFITFAVLQFADIITTDCALAVEGNWEANPLMAYAQFHLGNAWWLPKLAILGFVYVAAPLTRRRWPMVFAVSYYVIIVSGNVICL